MIASVWSFSLPWPPRWKEIAAPVARLARTDARMLFTSLGSIGPPCTPTSPMTPDLTPVSRTPTVTSLTISSAMSSTVRSSMSAGWYAFWYHPEPITMLSPVARETRSSPTGSRWMPVLVTSTIESPPILRNSIASRMARSSSERIQLSKIDRLVLARWRFSSVSFSPQRATSEAGESSSGATCFASAMNRCSCMIVTPRSPGSIGPVTVMILPVGASSIGAPFVPDDAASYQSETPISIFPRGRGKRREAVGACPTSTAVGAVREPPLSFRRAPSLSF